MQVYHVQELLDQTWKGNSILPKPSSPSPVSTVDTSSKSQPVVSKLTMQVATARQAADVPTHSGKSSLSRLQPKDLATNSNRVGNVTEDDAEMSPEPQDHETESQTGEVAARDEESAQIVKQLERGLPRWSGGDNRGWMDDSPKASDKSCPEIQLTLSV
jgi:chromatin structure-remodeling complex subunit RSC1/2